MLNKDKFSICLISSTTIIFFLVCFTLLTLNYFFIKIFFILNYFIYIISFIIIILINPGIPERKYYIKYIKNKNENEHQLKCKKCNIIVPKSFKISHCYYCDICTKEKDHHCPWTGKCIAKNNLKIFYIFITSLFLFIINIFVTLCCSFIYRENHLKL